MRRSPRAVLALVAALAVAAGACTSQAGPGKIRSEVGLDFRLVSALEPFDACGDLLDHVRQEATSRAGQLGFLGGGWGRWGGDVALGGVATAESGPTAAPVPRAAADGAARAVTGSAPGPAVSGTNVQEAGVDEPDLVKTDGRRIVTVAGGELQVLTVEGGRHRRAGSLPLPGSSGAAAHLGGGDHDLLLAGDRVLVRSSVWTAPVAPDGAAEDRAALSTIAPGQARIRLTLVDISDPEAPTVVSTLEVDGHSLGARMVGDIARVVTSAGPRGFAPVFPADGSQDEQARVEAAHRAQLEASTLRNWLPEYTLEEEAGSGRSVSGIAVGCDRVSHPAEFSGLGTISVLTFDLSEGLSDGDAVSVLADGQTVYASEESLYVATTRYPEVMPLASGPTASPPPLPEETTEIHKFDITGDGPARHVASGRVRGHLLNQFSMSEHEDRLRVATTDSLAGGVGGTSESLVTVLEDRAGTLEAVGEVGGLGRGEQIYAVRFMGPVGYVVTFRQIDPLYTLDLSDPARPRVVGELKIPGYSAYLHPVGEGLLLGVGQDATMEGRRIGAQASLFDVSDPARPRRLDQVDFGPGASGAEFDHHAFLWWEPAQLAVLPLQVHDAVAAGTAVGLSVAPGRGLAEVGRITHQPTGDQVPDGHRMTAGAQILRSLVIGETLYTVSSAGVLASGLRDLAPHHWVAL